MKISFDPQPENSPAYCADQEKLLDLIAGDGFDLGKIQKFVEDTEFLQELRKDSLVQARVLQIAEKIRKDSEMPEVRGFPASQREFLACQLVALFPRPEKMN